MLPYNWRHEPRGPILVVRRRIHLQFRYRPESPHHNFPGSGNLNWSSGIPRSRARHDATTRGLSRSNGLESASPRIIRSCCRRVNAARRLSGHHLRLRKASSAAAMWRVPPSRFCKSRNRSKGARGGSSQCSSGAKSNTRHAAITIHQPQRSGRELLKSNTGKIFAYLVVPHCYPPFADMAKDKPFLDHWAATLRALILSEANSHPIGWIVDLRGNGGSNMWAALAGLGPLLGEGPVGFFKDRRGRQEWVYDKGRNCGDVSRSER